MAVVLISTNVADDGNEQWRPKRGLVQVDTNVYIAIAVNGTGALSRWKSIDALATWSSILSIGAEASGELQVDTYYQRWNNRGLPNKIQAFHDKDFGASGMYHRSYNVDSDSVTTAVLIEAAGGPHPSARGGGIGQALSGRLYADGGGHAFFGSRTEYSDDDGATWTVFGATLGENSGGEYLQIWPEFYTDDEDDVCALFWELGGAALTFKRVDASGGSISESASFMSGLGGPPVSTFADDGRILVAAAKASDGSIKTFSIADGVVTAKGDVITSGAAGPAAIAYYPNGHIGVFYVRGTSIYFKLSTDGMTSWGSEQLYSAGQGDPVAQVHTDPRPLTQAVAAMWITTGEVLYTEAPITIDADVEQYRLMLAEVATPNIPTLNVTEKAFASKSDVLIKTERGSDLAVLGGQPRAGHASVSFNNLDLAYALDNPEAGLALRLNKNYDDDWYHMWTGNIVKPRHLMRGIRPTVELTAHGPLARLAGKKVTTELLGRGYGLETTTGAAIVAVLEACGIESYEMDIDTGDVELPYYWASESDALSELNKIVMSEGITAHLYEDGEGKIVFKDRSARYDEARSATIQFTFRLSSTEPLFSEWEYESGRDEIVNSAKHRRIPRTNDSAPTVVWDLGTDVYIVSPGVPLVFEAIATEPFFDAITPVLNTDYTEGVGVVDSVTINRTSGQRVLITFNSAGGCLIGSLQLRATTTIVGVDEGFTEVSSVDASASIAQFGPRPWTGSMSEELAWADMRANLDALVTWKMVQRGRIKFSLNAKRGAIELHVANQATAQLEIGDRVRVINPNHDFDGEGWISKISHEVFAPAGEANGNSIGREITRYEIIIISVAVGSGGTGVGEDNPYDSIDYSGSPVPGAESPDDDHGIPTRGAATV